MLEPLASAIVGMGPVPRRKAGGVRGRRMAVLLLVGGVTGIAACAAPRQALPPVDHVILTCPTGSSVVSQGVYDRRGIPAQAYRYLNCASAMSVDELVASETRHLSTKFAVSAGGTARCRELRIGRAQQRTSTILTVPLPYHQDVFCPTTAVKGDLSGNRKSLLEIQYEQD